MWELIHFFAFFYISLHMVMLHSLSTAYILILKHLHSFPQAAFLYAAFYIFALCSAACICIHSSFDISCIAPSLHLAAFTQPATFTCIVMHSPKYTFWCIEGANCIPLHFASFIKCCMHEHLYFDQNAHKCDWNALECVARECACMRRMSRMQRTTQCVCMRMHASRLKCGRPRMYQNVTECQRFRM